MKQKVKQWIAYMLSFCMVFGMAQFAPAGAVYAAEAADGEIDESQKGVQIVRYLTGTEMSSGDKSYLASYTDRLEDFIAGTESMTWSVQFKTSESAKLQGLLLLERNDTYCSFYLKEGKLAFEPVKNTVAVSGSASYADNRYHTAELEIIKGEAVILRMDGNELDRSTSPTLLKDLSWTPTAFTIGGSKDYSSASGWKFQGSMKNVVLTKNVLASVWDGANLPDSAVPTGCTENLAQLSFTMAYRLKEEAKAKTTLMTLGSAEVYADSTGDKSKVGLSIDGANVIEGTVDSDLGTAKWHNVAFVKEDSGLKLYVDGVLTGSGTLADGAAINASTVQKGEGIYCSKAELYDCAFSAEQMRNFHDNTNLTDYPDPTPKLDGYYKGPNRDLFNAGYDNSVSYRIPAITYDKKHNVLVASIDKRCDGNNDGAVTDTVVRRSLDGGETWEDSIMVIDMPDQQAYTTDPVMVTDNDPASDTYGRIFILVDQFPKGISWGGAEVGTGYKKIDGKDYMVLYDSSQNEYTVRENGIVYDSDNNPTEYRVETEAEAPYKEQGDLYKSGERIGSIYKGSELVMLKTCHLWMTYSDDGGLTWSRPRDLNPEVKADWMSFFGTGPGAGTQLYTQEQLAGADLDKGRLIFSTYSNRDNNAGHFSSYNVYTDDGGETWHRGGTPNDTQPGGASQSNRQLNENCIVALDNGHLIQFMKNSTNEVATAVSEDGGETWGDVSYQRGINEVYCELAVLHYGDLVDPRDNQTKEAIIFANPAGPGRTHGTVRIAFVNAGDTLDWAYDKLIEEKNFLYNSMALIDDGKNPKKIGMIYENEKAETAAAFTSFSPQYIMDPNVYENTPQPAGITADILDASGNKTETLRIGNELRVKIKFDNKVFSSGNVTSNIRIGDDIKEARLIGNADDNTLEFSYTVEAGDTDEITALAEVNVKAGGVAETVYNVPLTNKPFVTKTAPLGRAQAEGFAQLPTAGMTASAGSEHTSNTSSNEGPASHVLNDNRGQYWHTKYDDDNAPAGRPKHYITLALGGSYLVSGLTYLPRENAGNGTITKYQIEVSADGTTFYPYEIGDWALNGDLKTVNFQYGPVAATHVRLRSLESTGSVSSAAAVRIIGKSQTGAAAISQIRMGLVQELLQYRDIEDKLTAEETLSLAQALSAAKEVAKQENPGQGDIDQAFNGLAGAVDGLLTNFDDMVAAAEDKEEGAYTTSSWARYMAAVQAAQELASDAKEYEKLAAYLDLKEAEAGLKAASVSKVFVKSVEVTSAGNVRELERGDTPATLQLSVKVTPDNASDQTVVWISGDKSKVTVDQTGLVTTANKTGEVTVTAMTKDGSCKKGEITLTVTGEDKANLITAPSVSYTKPEADAYPMPASIAAGGESSAHHDGIHDWSKNPVELLSKASSSEPVKYVDGVWAINDQLMASESGEDDKFDVISGTSSVFSFKLYAKSFANNTALISKGDHQYCIKLLNNNGEGISAFAGEWKEGAYKYKNTGDTTYTPALNQWADVIWVIDKAGKVRIYVDGKAGSTSDACTIAKSKSRFAIGGKNDNDSGNDAGVWGNALTAAQGYLADVRFYKDAAVSDISLDEMDAAYDTDAKSWAYLSGLLDSVDPTANYTGMPYDVKTEWRADGGAVVAPGSKFADNASYTATTTFTAHDGFVFPTESAEKTAFENEVKAAVRAGEAAAEAGSVTVTVESESVMKVAYACEIGSGERPADCSCEITSLSVGPEEKAISIAADGSNNTLQLSSSVTKKEGCAVSGHPGGNAVSYEYEVADAGATGATVSRTGGLVTAQEAGTAVITVKATLSSGTVKTRTENVSISVTKESGGSDNDNDKADAESKAGEAIEKLEEIVSQKGGSISAGDTLPLELEGTALSWSAKSEYVTIDDKGNVTVKEGLTEEKDIEFTVTVSYGEGQSVTRSVFVKVKPVETVIDPPAKYTVTFDSRGGTAMKAVTVEENQAVSKPAAAPVKKGYSFAGWYSDPNCVTAYNFASKVTKNITLYAKWTANTYQVKFNANGSGVSGMPGSVSKKYNETLDLSKVRQPVRKGYKFSGWSRTGNGSAITSLKVTETVTLYAKWEEIPKLTPDMKETVGKIKYKVLDADKKTVAVTGSVNKKATGIKIPDTVPINGVTCVVAQIGPNAFKGYGKLKKVTLGKNVAVIGKNAFSGCKKLDLVTLKGKALKSVQSGAFKNTSKKLKVKVSKMTKPQKKKLLKALKKGGNKKITIK